MPDALGEPQLGLEPRPLLPQNCRCSLFGHPPAGSRLCCQAPELGTRLRKLRLPATPKLQRATAAN